MKKICILIALPFMCFMALSAQITQEQADDIVWERLNRVSVLYYSLFAKEDVQENMIIETAVGEILELDYPCWVYYINNIDFYLIVNENNGNVLEIKPTSDAVPNDLEEWRRIGIGKIQWQLLGIVDVETGNLTEFECKRCFTITFDTDSTFSARFSINNGFGFYNIDYKTGVLNLFRIASTELPSKWEEYEILYYRTLIKVQSFIMVNNTYPRTLHLYYNDGENYLKYEEIGGRNE